MEALSGLGLWHNGRFVFWFGSVLQQLGIGLGMIFAGFGQRGEGWITGSLEKDSGQRCGKIEKPEYKEKEKRNVGGGNAEWR